MKVGTRLRALLASMFVLVGSVVVVAIGPALPARAETGGYPYADYNGPGTSPADSVWTDSSGNSFSEYGYVYRNCTDYVAWKLRTLGVDADRIKGLGNGAEWYDNAPQNGLSRGTTPKVGAVAVSGSGSWGHVAYVEAVNADSTITVSEYNWPHDTPSGVTYDGLFHRSTTSSYSKFVYFAEHMTNPPDGSGSSPPPSGNIENGYFHGTPPDGAVIENHDGGLHKYVAVGGSLVWIPPERIWDYVDQMHRRFPPGHAFREIVWMHANEVHDIEYGYGGDRSHVPADNSFFYEPNGRQFVVQYRYAFEVGSSQEVDYLSGRDKAVLVPSGTGSRMSGVPDIPNDVLLKAQNNPAYYHMSWGTAYWANNFTVIDCIRVVKHGAEQPVPGSLITTLQYAGRLTSQVTACSFPADWALFGPGGNERWRMEGDNSSRPYVRHYYPSPLVLRCHLGSNPTQVELPHVAGINGAPEGPALTCPPNTFVRDTGNSMVWRIDNGVLRYVPSPAVLTCLTWGNNGIVIDVGGDVLAGMPQGEVLSCGFEGKMLLAPDGRVVYAQQGQTHPVLNPAIRDCLKGRAGTGDPVLVDQGLFNSYTASPDPAFCPYGPGIRFVQGAGQAAVWRVYPDGTRQHADGFCVPDPFTTTLAQFRVHVVPAGEVDGHALRSPSVFHAGAAECAAIP